MYSPNNCAWYKTTVWNQLKGSTDSSSLSNTNSCCQTASIRRLGYLTKSIRFYIHRPMNWNYVKVKNKINIDGKGHLHTPRSKKSRSSTSKRLSLPELTHIPTIFGIEFIHLHQFCKTHTHKNTRTNKYKHR